MTRSGYLVACVLVSVLAACGQEEGDLVETSSELGADSGVPSPPPPPTPEPAMAITIGADPTVRTGFAISSDLVVTSRSWLTSATDPRQVTVQAHRTSNAQRAIAVTVNDYFPMAFIQVGAPLTLPYLAADSADTPAQLVGDHLVCYNRDPGRGAYGAGVRIERVDGDREVLGAAGSVVTEAFVGGPCYHDDRGLSGPLVGFVLSVSGTYPASRPRIFVTRDTRWFRDRMVLVAGLRSRYGNGFKVHTRASNGTAMCLDVPWGYPYDRTALNVFPCNGGNNQRFFPDATNPWGTAWVNAQTGNCIDVPDAKQEAGVGMQMSGCNNGRNQAIVENAGGTLSPLSSPQVASGTNAGKLALCLAPSAGGSSASSRVVQTWCNFSPFQYVYHLWSITAL